MLKKHIKDGNSYKTIAVLIERDENDVIHRWNNVLNPDTSHRPKKRKPWTKEEDEKVRKLVMEKGALKWSQIAAKLPGRIGKQCRERWHNHLNPAIKKTA